MESIATDNLLGLKTDLSQELNSVLSYWINNSIDLAQGGFFGSVNNQNIPDKDAAKGVVLHSRILWTFSAAYNITPRQVYLQTAERAYKYILDKFIDHEYGGVYWSVDAAGNMLDGKKQIYGLAFAIYGLTEYFKVTNDNHALNIAIELYKNIEEYSFDNNANGYIEAFARDWNDLEDLRLSAKDSNERKTMNTHLHIIEAYANLYSVWPNNVLKGRIINLLYLFDHYFISKENFHLHLFFNDAWQPKSLLQSFGHDIEAAWLLQQCAEIIHDDNLIDRFKELALPITNAAAEGLDSDGGLWYEYEPSSKELIAEKHSWPQAEAMIGFMNAFQLTGDYSYAQKVLGVWEFVKKHIRDDQYGEWFWGVYHGYSLKKKNKVGFWKCPYPKMSCFY